VSAKPIVWGAIITGLLMWGLSELFAWIIGDLIGAVSVARIAPGLAGALLGAWLGVVRNAIQRKREEMLSGEGKPVSGQ
jgi:hypothetical protein